MARNVILKVFKKVSGIDDVSLEVPENLSFGDYSTNIAMVVAKKNSLVPRKFAEELVEKLKKEKELMNVVDKIEVDGPGFINFWVKTDVLVDGLRYIDISIAGKGKNVVIDYSSPNIAKPFGIGHLRSTIIGQALYNLYKALGYEVVGDNHLGDWGTQFGKLLYMIKNEDVKEFDISKLEELYVKFHEIEKEHPEADDEARKWFKKLEDGDTEARTIWKKCIDVSIKEFNRIYDLLGVKIDFTFGESYYETEMKSMIANQDIKKLLVNGEDGAKIIDLSKEGINVPLMFLKKDGGTTYATRDLATLIFRVRKWNPDLIIYEVGAEQTLHFKQLFAAARIMGIVKNDTQLVHTGHGLYLGSDGKKFATRKGKTIKLEEVLDEAIKRAKELGSSEETSSKVGVGAIKYFDLMHKVSSDVIFEWDKVLNMDGNSGPYLQYTYARAQSILSKGNEKKELEINKFNEFESKLLRRLIHFGEVIETSAKSYSPNLLCNYLYELAQDFNTFYNQNKVIGSDNEYFRLLLTSAVAKTLKKGLDILGIDTPERM